MREMHECGEEIYERIFDYLITFEYQISIE